MGPLMFFTQQNRHSRSPAAMSQESASTAPKFSEAANGIVPGYQGHVPGARDNYGVSHMGGLSYEKWVTNHAGPQSRHEKPQEAEAASSVNIQHRREVNGIMPGCAPLPKLGRVGCAPRFRANSCRAACLPQLPHHIPLGAPDRTF